MARDMFQFVVIDSVSRLGLTPSDLLELRNTHPNRTIIGIMEANKDGATFKGANDWKHHANLMIKVEKVTNEAGRVGAKCTVEKSQYGRDGNSVTIKF
jgi:undecaprenyl pyrophosphate synthase